MSEHGWTSKLSESRCFDTTAEAEAALATVGETVWHVRVVRKTVGSRPRGGREYPIVFVETEHDDGSKKRFFMT